MLFVVFLLLALWFLGFMTSATLGGVLHILLVVAILLFLVHIIQGRQEDAAEESRARDRAGVEPSVTRARGRGA